MNSKCSLGSLLCATALAFSSIAPAADEAGPARALAGSVRPVLVPGLIQVGTERLAPGTSNLVLLVGENHASVAGQKRLADLAAGLLQAKALDAILIEGTSGPIDTASLKETFATPQRTPKALQTYCMEQLDSGLLAGYEYVTLLRPGLEVYGVEDMVAKTRNSGYLTERGWRQQSESHERAAVTLETALAALRASAPKEGIAGAQSEIRDVRKAATNYSACLEALLKKWRESTQLEAGIMALQGKQDPAVKRLKAAQPSYEDYRQWHSEREQIAAPLRERLKKAQSGGRLGGLNSLLDSDKDGAGSLDRLSLEAAVREATPKLEALRRKTEAFEEAHAADLQILQDIYKSFRRLSSELEEAQTALEPLFKPLKQAEDGVWDAYYIGANLLNDLAAKQGRKVAALNAFFKSEQQRQNQDDPAVSKVDLDERDKAMTANTIEYLNSHPARVVLLVVGYAHVAGLEEKLAARGVSFISGRVAGSEAPIEPWEQAAWSARKRAGRPVFSTAKESRLKEVTLLVNEGWKTEQTSKLAYFEKLQAPGGAPKPIVSGLAWGGRVFDGIGGRNRVMRTGSFPYDPNAKCGAHVVDRGAVPGRPGEFYEVIDRDAAAREAVRNSDEKTAFVFFQQTPGSGGGGPGCRLTSAAGTQSLPEFVAKPPARGAAAPKRVVLFGEADEVMQGGAVVSPLWQALRQSGKGQWTGSMSDPNLSGQPEVMRAANPERASRNLQALDKQQAEFQGEVQFLDDTALATLTDKLRFTPSRGDHTHMVVLMGKNASQLRAAIRTAGEARLLEGKQVVLLTCGPSFGFGETAALREGLFREGARMVWNNGQPLSMQAGQRVCQELRKVIETTLPAQRKTVNEMMNRALYQWSQTAPQDPDLKSLEQSAAWLGHVIPHGPGAARTLS